MFSLEDPHVQAVLQTVMIAVISLLGTVLTGGIAWLSRSAKQWLDGKAHAATFQCAMAKIESVTTSAVEEVEQTLVRKLKREGKWNAETAKDARDTAVGIAKRHLGERGMKELEGCLGHVQESIEGILRTHVEKYVRKMGTTNDESPLVDMGK